MPVKMPLKFMPLSAVFLLLAVGPSLAESPSPLSVAEAIRLAVEGNLDLKAELYNPAQDEADIHRYRAIYEPLFAAQTRLGDADFPSYLTAYPAPVRTKSAQVNASLSQLLASGATLSLGMNNLYQDTDAPLNPPDVWQSNLGLSLTQPLLKGFGRENTEIMINVAKLAKAASLKRLTSRLLDTVAQTRREYFTLYRLREQREVKKVSLELARKILAETKSKVEAGVLPAMEILNAEYGVAAREKELLAAEQQVHDQSDHLRLLLQFDGPGELVPTDTPRRDLVSEPSQEAIDRAMTRPDILERQQELKIGKLQAKFLGNQTRPDLSLSASNSLAGQHQRLTRDLENLGGANYPTWSVWLNLTYPLGNEAAENAYRKGLLKNEQTAIQIKALRQTAANQVGNALRAVDTEYKQIEVTKRGRAYAESRLQAFIRKNEVGLATTKDVLDVENDLAAAKSAQIAALTDYDNAVTTLWQATGELLDRAGIHLDSHKPDQLYQETTSQR